MTLTISKILVKLKADDTSNDLAYFTHQLGIKWEEILLRSYKMHRVHLTKQTIFERNVQSFVFAIRIYVHF